MPLPRTNRPRRNWSFSSLTKSSPLQIGAYNNNAKKKKVIGNREVQAFVFVILSMAAFPLLFLHRYLQSPSSLNKKHHHKNDTQIQNSLDKYYKEREEHRHNHWRPKTPPLISASDGYKDNAKMNHQGIEAEHVKVVTAYLEPVDTMPSPDSPITPLPIRKTSAERLKEVVFPFNATSENDNVCSRLMQDFPIDTFPLEDPFLPWIHDYFPSSDGKHIQFIAQNKRRCATGEGNEKVMEFWEPQVALFQSIPVIVQRDGERTIRQQEGEDHPMTFTTADDFYLAWDTKLATHRATRFQCHFHTSETSIITLSDYNFDYEFINWRKGRKTMISREGAKKDVGSYWLSQLLFKCPVPLELQPLLVSTNDDGNQELAPKLYLDLVPIRTPVRSREVLLTSNSTGPGSTNLHRLPPTLDLKKAFGDDHLLPKVQDAGRWANLPICPREATGPEVSGGLEQKKNRLVACTWTASSYTRRGDALTISDSGKRLEEWIRFHLQVGFDHLYVYDNSDESSTALFDIAKKFGNNVVTYHRWPCKVCNNNRPAHKNPGERSSQYAAEASCRERYGDSTEWMSFIDTDEYLVPMQQNEEGAYHWKPVLDEMDTKGISIMKFLSSRGLPRVDLMEVMEDQSSCVDPSDVKGENKDKTEPCMTVPTNKTTYLQVYNCDYIRPPKPVRFQRAMKQIYRPSYVLSHFVHYSTVTADLAETYSEFEKKRNERNDQKEFILRATDSRFIKQSPELFVDELKQGALIHARSILPHETKRRSAECYSHSKYKCMIGYLCDDSVAFSDDKHKDNAFVNPDGSYCNCWRNPVVDEILGPILLQALKSAS